LAHHRRTSNRPGFWRSSTALSDIAQAEDVGDEPCLLAGASPAVRQAIARRPRLHASRAGNQGRFLDRGFQEQLQQLSNQRLKAPWAIDENEYEAMEHAAVLFPRSVAKDDERSSLPSARGGFGQYTPSSTWDDVRRAL
jgi:hypothetical protein